MNGTIHHLTTGILIFPVAWVGWHFTGDPTIAAFMGIGCAAGLIVHPDLDQREQCHKTGCFWWLYGKLFHHRGISHFPILGTLTRLIYLGLPFAMVWLLLGRPTIPEVVIKAAAWAALGLSLSDLGHLILDIKL